MKINFLTGAIEPMYEWLIASKKTGIRDEIKLREILNRKEYSIEFERYGNKNLPVCTIDYDEAVDFFLNFDKKSFKNPRLDYKQKSFLDFYKNIESKLGQIKMFESFDKNDYRALESYLSNSLPDGYLKEIDDINILLIISIGNSMGWPHRNYIDFDLANFGYFPDKDTFLHVIAHEINHMAFSSLIKENMSPQELFAVNFAFEGLAVHFCNNAHTLHSKGKYGDKMICMDLGTWKFFDEQFDELFMMFKKDFEDSKVLSEEEVGQLISSKYETFEFTSLKSKERRKVLHYPTYYLGTFLWGIIDDAFGKETLYKTLKEPSAFKETYNKAAKKLGIEQYSL